MDKLPNGVINFAAGNERTLKLMTNFMDYFNHSRANDGVKGLNYQTVNSKGEMITFAQKEEQINAALRAEVLARAGVPGLAELPVEQWSTNPNVSWALFSIVSQMIDAILPVTMIETTGLYAETKVIGYGDSAVFDIEPRDLFVVSKGGRGMRTAEIKRQSNGQVALVPEPHIMTVGVSLYRVLSGHESLAKFAAKAVRSMETQVAVDTYTSFATAMAALPTTAGVAKLRQTGYTQDGLVELAQKVEAWNSGSAPVIVGTKRALAQVLPNDANYRYALESEYVKVGYIKNFVGYDVIALPQVANWNDPFGVVLDDAKIWIVSPGSSKLVRTVFEGSTMNNTTGIFDAATLVQTSTFSKNWISGVVTSSLAATITL